ncbi:MAG: hypothetical protein HQL50_03685 [Magnetococcales bacterium]|nr:hypothetical protein [Magnetococcales bacterium]
MKESHDDDTMKTVLKIDVWKVAIELAKASGRPLEEEVIYVWKACRWLGAQRYPRVEEEPPPLVGSDQLPPPPPFP